MDGTNSKLKQVDVEIQQMCQQLGFDQVSSRYFLTAMTAHVSKLENMEWQLSGGKRLANPSLKETTIAVLDHMKKNGVFVGSQ